MFYIATLRVYSKALVNLIREKRSSYKVNTYFLVVQTHFEVCDLCSLSDV